MKRCCLFSVLAGKDQHLGDDTTTNSTYTTYFGIEGGLPSGSNPRISQTAFLTWSGFFLPHFSSFSRTNAILITISTPNLCPSVTSSPSALEHRVTKADIDVEFRQFLDRKLTDVVEYPPSREVQYSDPVLCCFCSELAYDAKSIYQALAGSNSGLLTHDQRVFII